MSPQRGCLHCEQLVALVEERAVPRSSGAVPNHVEWVLPDGDLPMRSEAAGDHASGYDE